MVALVQRPDQLKRSSAIREFLLETALNFTFFNDIEVVTLVLLMEDIFVSIHLNYLQAVDQLEFVVGLQSLE